MLEMVEEMVEDQKFTVEINCGDVFIDGKFVSQLCWNPDSVGYAIASYLRGVVDEGEEENG